MLPFFYIPAFDKENPEILLNEETSKHVVQVLRMKNGELIQLTDGKGYLFTAAIIDDHKKKCRVRVQSTIYTPPSVRRVLIAISLLKNASRFEWFLEKVTEIGVSSIIPLLCERTEKQHARTDRLRNILVSAMLQSQQTWLPDLADPTPLADLLSSPPCDRRFIAHCLETPDPASDIPRVMIGSATTVPGSEAQLILIGPEGDFSPKEIESALKEGFLPVTLGDNRLRTETAGVVAATLLCIG